MENKSIAGQIAASYLKYSKQAINKGEEPISLDEYVKKFAPTVNESIKSEFSKSKEHLDSIEGREEKNLLILRPNMSRNDWIPLIQAKGRNVVDVKDRIHFDYNFEVDNNFSQNHYNGHVRVTVCFKNSFCIRQIIIFKEQQYSEVAFGFIRAGLSDPSVKSRTTEGGEIIKECYSQKQGIVITMLGKIIVIELK